MLSLMSSTSVPSTTISSPVLKKVLSIALMAFAANFIASLLDRFRWIAYAGLAIIVWVAGDMIYRGGIEVYTKFMV